jgi:hypothetical protein
MLSRTLFYEKEQTTEDEKESAYINSVARKGLIEN